MPCAQPIANNFRSALKCRGVPGAEVAEARCRLTGFWLSSTLVARFYTALVFRQEPQMNRTVTVLLAMLLATAAQAAEYMQKTPFQLSRAFSPGVATSGGINGLGRRPDCDGGQPRPRHRQQFRSPGQTSVCSNRRCLETRRRQPGQCRGHDGLHQGIPVWRQVTWKCARISSRMGTIPAVP